MGISLPELYVERSGQGREGEEFLRPLVLSSVLLVYDLLISVILPALYQETLL